MRFALGGLSQYFAGSAATELLNAIRSRVFAHVQSLSVGYFDRTKAGRIISRADRDVDTLEPMLIQCPPQFLSAVLRLVLAAILLWAIAPTLLLGLAAVVPVLLLATVAFKRLAQRSWGRVAENRSRFTAHLVETVAGVRLIKQVGREAENLARYRGLLRDFNTTPDRRKRALGLVRAVHRAAHHRRPRAHARHRRPRHRARHADARRAHPEPVLRLPVPGPAAGVQ